MDDTYALRTCNLLAQGLTIRVARVADREQVIAVINAVATEHCSLRTDHYYPTVTWEALLSEGMNRTKGHVLLVVEHCGQIRGFARMASEHERECGVIGIALLPAYRSRGLGRLLLTCLLAWAPTLGITVLRADILADNKRSLRLFMGSGFYIVDQHKIALPYLPYPVEEISVVASAIYSNPTGVVKPLFWTPLPDAERR